MSVNISIKLEELINAIRNIPNKDKAKLVDILEDDLLKEFDSIENHPQVLREVRENYSAYSAGNFETLEHFEKSRKKHNAKV